MIELLPYILVVIVIWIMGGGIYCLYCQRDISDMEIIKYFFTWPYQLIKDWRSK